MAVKNTFLGGSDWGAEDWYYQDVNDTINRVAYISGASLSGVQLDNTIKTFCVDDFIALEAGTTYESFTNMSTFELININSTYKNAKGLNTTSTGSYSIVFPDIGLRKSYQTFVVKAAGRVGTKITDGVYTASSGNGWVSTFVSDITLYNSIHFNFQLNGTSTSNGSGILQFAGATSGESTVMLSLGNLTGTYLLDGACDIYFAPDHSHAVTRAVGFLRDHNGNRSPWSYTKYHDLSGFVGTVALEVVSESGSTAATLTAFGAHASSDNDLDDFATISLSTDGGTTWDALSGNGIPVTATAAGSSVKVKIEGSAAANDEKLVLRDITIIPVA